MANKERSAKWMRVTPNMAKAWLATRRVNRKVNESHIAFLERQMRDQTFVSTGEPLIFNERGELMEGQHRLMALVRADVTLEFLVVEGVPDEYFESLGQGRTRAAHDVASIAGVPNAVVVAGAARLMLRWDDEAGLIDARGTYGRADNHSIMEVVRAHPEVIDAASLIATKRILRGLFSSVACAFIICKLAQVSDMVTAVNFVERVADPVGIMPSDPRYILNRYLLNRRMIGKRMKIDDCVAVTFKTWNYLIQKVPVKNIVNIRKGEDFPIPVRYAPEAAHRVA